ncbi:MAG: PP2C family protein-serine/threonine phosphatase, partial [Actinomycetota bacterium]
THYAPLLQMQGSVRELAMDLVCAHGEELPVLVSSALKQGDDLRPAVIRVMILSARDRRNYERELLAQRRRAEESEARARALAETLQASFIPPALPRIDGLDLAGLYRPAGRGDEVGGDFYDVFETSGDDWAVVIGDVAGKGAEAAAITALARYTIRAAAAAAGTPSEVLGALNTAMIHQKVDRLCSAVYCRLRPGPGAFGVSLSVAGHPAPLLLKAAGEDARPVGQTGLMLGIADDPALEDAEMELDAGDCLLLYTDGVTEARRGGEFFDQPRLAATLKALRNESAGAIAAGIAAEVLDFQDGLARDDIAVVALKAFPSRS